jgi:hypothetical protein
MRRRFTCRQTDFVGFQWFLDTPTDRLQSSFGYQKR